MLNINSIGVKDIRKENTQALSSGDLRAGFRHYLYYDGSNFHLLNPYTLPDYSINALQIADNAVTGAKIGDGQLEAAHLGENSITTVKIVDDAITSAKIAMGAVGTTEICGQRYNSC